MQVLLRQVRQRARQPCALVPVSENVSAGNSFGVKPCNAKRVIEASIFHAIVDPHQSRFDATSPATREARTPAQLGNNFVMDRNDEIYVEQLPVLEGE